MKNFVSELMKCVPPGTEARLLAVEELEKEYCGKARPVWIEVVQNNCSAQEGVVCGFVADVRGKHMNEYEGGEEMPAGSMDNMIMICPMMKIVFAQEKLHYKDLLAFPIDGYNTRPYGHRFWSAPPTIEQRKEAEWVFSLDYSEEMKAVVQKYYTDPVDYKQMIRPFPDDKHPEDSMCDGCEDYCDACKNKCPNVDSVCCRVVAALVVSQDGEMETLLFSSADEARNFMYREYCDALIDNGVNLGDLDEDNDCVWINDDGARIVVDDEEVDIRWTIIYDIQCHADTLNNMCLAQAGGCVRADDKPDLYAVVFFEDEDAESVALFDDEEDAERWMTEEWDNTIEEYDIDIEDDDVEEDCFTVDNTAVIQTYDEDGDPDLKMMWIITCPECIK